jgi:hypothetical protein
MAWYCVAVIHCKKYFSSILSIKCLSQVHFFVFVKTLSSCSNFQEEIKDTDMNKVPKPSKEVH